MDRNEASLIGMAVSTLPEVHRIRVCEELTASELGYEFTAVNGEVRVVMSPVTLKKRAVLSAKLMMVGVKQKKGAPNGRLRRR